MASRPVQLEVVSSTARWGRLLCLAAALILIGLGFRGPLAVAGAANPAQNALAAATFHPAPAGGHPGASGERTAEAGCVVIQARHLRTIPAAPTGGAWPAHTESAVPVGRTGEATPSGSEPTPQAGWSESGCRGPPGSSVAL